MALLDQLIEEIIIRDDYKEYFIKNINLQPIIGEEHAHYINNYLFILKKSFRNEYFDDSTIIILKKIFIYNSIKKNYKLYLLKYIAKDLSDINFITFLNYSK